MGNKIKYSGKKSLRRIKQMNLLNEKRKQSTCRTIKKEDPPLSTNAITKSTRDVEKTQCSQFSGQATKTSHDLPESCVDALALATMGPSALQETAPNVPALPVQNSAEWHWQYLKNQETDPTEQIIIKEEIDIPEEEMNPDALEQEKSVNIEVHIQPIDGAPTLEIRSTKNLNSPEIPLNRPQKRKTSNTKTNQLPLKAYPPRRQSQRMLCIEPLARKSELEREIKKAVKRKTYPKSKQNEPTSSNNDESQLWSIAKCQEDILKILQKQHESRDDNFDNFSRYVSSLLKALPRERAFALQPRIISLITAEHMKLNPARTEAAKTNSSKPTD